MPSHQRDEPSSLSTASASSSNSALSAASTGVFPDTTDTTLMTEVITKTETIAATATGSSTGISSAISAGIGAGTGIAVAGLILLLVAAVVFFRRRKRRHPDPTPPTPPTPPTQIAETRFSVSIESTRDSKRPGLAALLDDCRLTAGSSSNIKEEFSTLDFMIYQHAEGCYHLNPTLVSPETLHASLCQLQLSEATCRTIVRLSVDPNTRHVAIRHLLALVIFSNLDTHSVGCLSLLPPVLKEMFKSRPKAYKRNQDLIETALVNWNRLTAFLMHENPELGTPVPLLPSVESQVKTLVTLLQDFLVHFAHTGDDGSHGFQQARLESIIGECAKFGYEVFSNPSDWRLTFPQQERGVIVLPGLERHSDGIVGELYDSPIIILSPEVVTVDLMED